jgi:hypothetical protein
MASSTLELAKELTLALVQTGNVAPEDIQETLQKTYTTPNLDIIRVTKNGV